VLRSRHGGADQAAVPAAVADAGRPRAGDVRSLPSPRRLLAVRRVRGAGPQRRDPRCGDAGPADCERAWWRARHGRGDRALRRRAAGGDQRAAARRASRLPVLGAYRHGRGAARDRRGAVGAPALETVAGPARRLAAGRPGVRRGADLGPAGSVAAYQAPPAPWNPAPQAPPWDQTPHASLDRTPQAPWNPASPPDAPQSPESWVDPR
jgi:hypothetical protein